MVGADKGDDVRNKTKQNRVSREGTKVRYNCSANPWWKVVYIFEFEVVDIRWIEQTKSEYRREGRVSKWEEPSFILAIEIAGLLLFKGQAREAVSKK